MAETLRLVIVEDSDDGRSIEKALQREGFVVRSSRVEDLDNLRQDLGLERSLRWVSVVRREMEETPPRGAEAKYAAAFRASPNALALTALEDGRFLEANEALCQVTGYCRQDVVGHTALELGFWPDEATRERFIRELRDKGSVRDFELAVRRKDGRILDMMMSAEIVELSEERAVLSIIEDVTERKRACRALELSEQRFSKIFFANPNPALITTLTDGKILEVNETACQMSGFGRDELIGRHGIDLGLWDEAHADRVQRLLEKHGAARDLELQARGRDGAVHDLLVSTVVVEMAGEPCVLNVAVDMTERNRLQAQLLRAQRLETLGTLAGSLAHDLNNVLTPILAATKLLRNKRPDQLERVAGILESNAHRGADLIRQLLSFTRGSDGKRVPVRLDSLVREIGSLVEDTFPKAIRLEVHVDPDLWTVEGDPTQFQQVLLNLAVNARDAMDGAGTLSIGVRNRELVEGDGKIFRGLPPGRYVELEVADTGPGIPEELRPQIFDPFFSTKEPGHGTGLGLFTVERIVTAHGGFVDLGAASEEGGTRFRVYLPTERAGEGKGGRSLLPALPRGHGELVLIIDDEEAIRELAAGVLRASGYRTLLAADGCSGLSRFEEHRPDVCVVLIDIRIPGTDGVQTIRALRRLDPDVRIVALEGIGGRFQHSGCPPGADLCLRKPLTAQDLLEGLSRALGKRAGEEVA